MAGYGFHAPQRVGLRVFAIGAFTLVLGACAAKQAEAPPPAAPQVVIPPRPRPPLGAQANLVAPPADAFGNRRTINTGITPAQTLWNLRSAYNVAALDCMRVEHTDILDNYKQFLQANAKALTAANKQVDKEFHVSTGRPAVKARESYMTQVYNFYALPPTLPAFCDAALTMSHAAAALSPPLPAAPVKAKSAKGRAAKAVVSYKSASAQQLTDFAMAELPKLDRVFLDFYNSYDQYRADLANWQQKYAPTEVVPVPTPPASTAPAPTAPGVVLPSAIATTPAN